VSKAPQFVEAFGHEALKNLHGCAAQEAVRGAASPCQGLAVASRRPQVGFGNPRAALVFVSASPLDPGSAGNESFDGWLDREASLEHHMNFERVQPYFRFVRAVIVTLRERFGQTPAKNDALDLAFHTSMVRCVTGNPDRVTRDAVGLCTSRHLEPLLKALRPRAIVALGGVAAGYFWSRSGESWDAWRPIERLHGESLGINVAGHDVTVVLSVHPYQQRVEPRPEVIARALAERFKPEDILPQALRAA